MKERVQITIEPALLGWADELAELRHSNRSETIEQLIRDEWERRRGPLTISSSGSGHQIASAVARRKKQKGRAHGQSGSTPAP